MFDPSDFRPDDIVDAFDMEGERGDAAQAAQLVTLAASLAFGAERLPEERLAEVPGFARETLSIGPLPPIYATGLEDVLRLVRESFGHRFRDLGVRFLSGVPGSQVLASEMSDAAFVRSLWSEVQRFREPVSTLAFLAAHLWSPRPLLRAIAIAALALIAPGIAFLESAARALLDDEDADLRALGEVALRNLGAENLGFGVSPPAKTSPDTGVPRSILINGTFSGFATSDDWFWPTSDLAQHIRAEIPADLYSDEGSFYSWGGGFSGSGRRAAAQQLRTWTQDQGVGDLHMVFAHSHGGNVAFDYLQAGGTIELLVLLHTPVIARRRASWSTIADRVDKVLVLSTKLDWVVWLDRAASLALLRTPLVGSLEAALGEKAITMSGKITQAWLSHSYYTETQTWKDQNIAQNVARYHDRVHPR